MRHFGELDEFAFHHFLCQVDEDVEDAEMRSSSAIWKDCMYSQSPASTLR